jgi:hypothetical protein
MSNLTPEARPDRTGKVVIRWVRPQEGKSRAASIPAPAVALSARAESDTLDDLDDFLNEFGMNKWARDQPLHENVSRMSAELSEHLMHEFRTNPAVYSEVTDVSDLLDQIYGSFSTVPTENQDTVMRNLMDITPGIDITGDSENPCIIEATRAVHKAVGGFSRDTPYTDEEKTLFRSASFIVMRIKQDTLIHEMNGTGVAYFDDYLALDNTDAIEELSQHFDQIETLRERVAEHGTFTATIVRQIAGAGALWEGAL